MRKARYLIGLICLICLIWSNSAWAACAPPSDYSSCPEQNPEYNLQVRGYEPISGNKTLIPFNHPGDPNAPLLSTLIAGNGQPTIANLYQVHDWDWNNNQAGGPIQRPVDLPTGFDFATLVGFSTQNGQGILVPNSGYDIGGGYEVLVLFATPTSITLKYTLEDNVVEGYTIHLENFQVDSGLLNLYNQFNSAGRDELPTLMAGMQIGKAMGNEILVSIRDTGSFMDPRWLNDWWLSLDPAVARQLLLKAMKPQQIAQKYGQCKADQDATELARAKGPTLILKMKLCSINSAGQAVQEALNALVIDTEAKKGNLSFPDYSQTETFLEKSTLTNLSQAGKKPIIPQKTTLGKITFDVCQEKTSNWFNISTQGDFKTPGEWSALRKTTDSLSTMLNQQSFENKLTNEPQLWASSSLIAAVEPTPPGNCLNGLVEAGVQNVKIENNNVVYYEVAIRPTDYAIANGLAGFGDFAINGPGNAGFPRETWDKQAGMGYSMANMPAEGWFFRMGDGAGLFPQPNSVDEFNQWGWNLSATNLADKMPAGCPESFILRASDKALKPIPPPPPPPCTAYNPTGEPMTQVKAACAFGRCDFQQSGGGNPILSAIQALANALNPCPEVTFYVTPKYDTPFAQQIDQAMRQRIILGKFAPMGTNLPKTDALENAVFVKENSNEKYSTQANFSSTKGPEKAWDWLQQALTQYDGL